MSLKLKTKLISSLGKIFPDEIIGQKLSSATLLKNEPFSFQVAFKNDDNFNEATLVYVRVETDSNIVKRRVVNSPLVFCYDLVYNY